MASSKIPTATNMNMVLKNMKKMRGFNVKYMLVGGVAWEEEEGGAAHDEDVPC